MAPRSRGQSSNSPHSKPATRNKRGPKTRTVSMKAADKWQNLPADLRETTSLIINDACNRFEGSGDPEIEESLQFIKSRFQHKLSNLNVPHKKWTSERDVKYLSEKLEAERRWLGKLESELKETLASETRMVQELTEEAERLRAYSNSKDSSAQIHPILLNLERL